MKILLDLFEEWDICKVKSITQCSISKPKGGKITILIVYVDDIIVTRSDVAETNKLKESLACEFEIQKIKNKINKIKLGNLRFFLNIEVVRSRQGIFLSQRKYTLDLLKETRMLGCKLSDTPIDTNHKLGVNIECKVANKENYQKMVGKLIYLSHTRLNIAFAIGVVNQFMHSPNKNHMNAVFRIWKYQKETPGKGLLFSKIDMLEIEVYTVASWASSIRDHRFRFGHCTFLGGNLVKWRTKKQSIVARSSTEAKFNSLALGICELIWPKSLMQELKIANNHPMVLYCHNKAAINIAHNQFNMTKPRMWR